MSTTDDSAKRATFRTYGTSRVYRREPSEYHEPLVATAETPEVAEDIARALNAYTGCLSAALTYPKD